MHTFVNRNVELAFLNKVATRRRPGPAQMILLYGRRRVGKTQLLHQWVQKQGLPYTYWVAEKEPAALQRRKFYAAVARLSVDNAPNFSSWAEVWAAIHQILGPVETEKHILILDELPYAAESDPATLSALQHAWDQYFQDSQLILVLCGSQVKAMESLRHGQSPIFGRMTGQWYLKPLAFAHLKLFFPTWTAAERMALYAIVGGVPAYLRWLDETEGLVANIRDVLLDEGSMFMAEPMFLLYDEVTEPQSYLAALRAIGNGHHTLSAISNAAVIPTSHLSTYLSRLQELKFVERRLPATVPFAKRRTSRKGRYHIIDPYFRFYFRFMAPMHETLGMDVDLTMERIQRQLRAFVGQTTFEELSRLWVEQQGKAGKLDFIPQIVGSHWSRQTQADVVAVNWDEKQVLLGECKWGAESVGLSVINDLIERKTPHLLQSLPNKGEGWSVHYALFSRAGITGPALARLKALGGISVELAQLDVELE